MILELHYLVLNNHLKCLKVLINGSKNYLRATDRHYFRKTLSSYFHFSTIE